MKEKLQEKLAHALKLIQEVEASNRGELEPMRKEAEIYQKFLPEFFKKLDERTLVPDDFREPMTTAAKASFEVSEADVVKNPLELVRKKKEAAEEINSVFKALKETAMEHWKTREDVE